MAPENNPGWFKSSRGDDALEVIGANPFAYVLAAVIAHRARWKLDEKFNRFRVALGEALLGDYWNYGMSEQQYRTAKRQLEEWKLATFRTTNKGTIGKLIDTRLFVVVNHPSNEQYNTPSTNEQRTTNERLTTEQRLTKKERKEESKRGTVKPPPVGDKMTVKNNPEGVPQFEPVKPGLYLREYQAMIKHAREQIAAVKRNRGNYIRDLSDRAVELIQWLKKEGKPDCEARVKEILAREDSYDQTEMKPTAAAVVDAWRARIKDIERVQAGVIG